MSAIRSRCIIILCNASADLVHRVVPSHLQHTAIPCLDEALSHWSKGNSLSPPEGTAQYHQKNWDTPRVSHIADRLLEEAPDDRSRSQLLACSARKSGVWLNSLPIQSLGLRMDDDTVRVDVGLCLGAPLCKPHTCQHCGTQFDQQATHGLSCRDSEGCHHQNSAINDILHRALTLALVPSCLEPSGLSHTDGKCPDGGTLVKRQAPGLGCHMSGHLCTLLHHNCISRSRSCGCYSRGEEEG